MPTHSARWRDQNGKLRYRYAKEASAPAQCDTCGAAVREPGPGPWITCDQCGDTPLQKSLTPALHAPYEARFDHRETEQAEKALGHRTHVVRDVMHATTQRLGAHLEGHAGFGALRDHLQAHQRLPLDMQGRPVDSQGVARLLVNAWTGGSSNNHLSYAMQHAAQHELGLHNAYTDHFMTTMKAHDMAETHHGVLRHAVRGMYDHTQAWLKHHGISHVTLYRGMAVDPDHLRHPVVDAHLQPLSAFSSDSELAHSFARQSERDVQSKGGNHQGVVLAGSVPAHRIFSTVHTGLGTLAEHEFVVLGGKHQMLARRPDDPRGFEELARQHGLHKGTVAVIAVDHHEHHADWLRAMAAPLQKSESDELPDWMTGGTPKHHPLPKNPDWMKHVMVEPDSENKAHHVYVKPPAYNGGPLTRYAGHVTPDGGNWMAHRSIQTPGAPGAFANNAHHEYAGHYGHKTDAIQALAHPHLGISAPTSMPNPREGKPAPMLSSVLLGQHRVSYSPSEVQAGHEALGGMETYTNTQRKWAKSDICDELAQHVGSHAGARDLAHGLDIHRSMGLDLNKLSDHDIGHHVTNHMLSAWAADSGHGNKISLGMQHAAQQEFGLHDADTGHLPNLADHSTLHQHIPTLRHALRGMYDHTQRFLASKGIKNVTLHRGMHLGGYQLPPGHVAEAHSQPISSFTPHLRTANSFVQTSQYPSDPRHGVLLGGSVPAHQVLSTARTGLGCLEEHEYTVLGGRMHTLIAHGQPHHALEDDHFHEIARQVGALRKARQQVPTHFLQIDRDPHNADWAKRTWDLPDGHDLHALRAQIAAHGLTVSQFLRTPFYQHHVRSHGWLRAIARG